MVEIAQDSLANPNDNFNYLIDYMEYESYALRG